MATLFIGLIFKVLYLSIQINFKKIANYNPELDSVPNPSIKNPSLHTFK